MKSWALDYLACPVTNGWLHLVDAEINGDDIISGKLISPEGRSYEILNGVPRFSYVVGSNMQTTSSVESFGFEWNTLNFDLFYANWMEHIVKRNFGSTDFFKNKIVLDCGAGSGMHSRWMIEAGAARVISLELSNTVDNIMRTNLAPYSERNLIVQCDIANPPIKKGVVDLIYCINVVQHTKDPVNTTHNLYSLLQEGNELYINYYRMPEDWWGQLRIKMGELFRRKITAKLPKGVLLNLIRMFALTTYLPLLDKIALQFLICGEVPEGEGYKTRRYRQTVLNTYDWFGSHDFQYHYHCSELLTLFTKAGIKLELIPNLETVISQALPGMAFKFVGVRPPNE